MRSCVRILIEFVYKPNNSILLLWKLTNFIICNVLSVYVNKFSPIDMCFQFKCLSSDPMSVVVLDRVLSAKEIISLCVSIRPKILIKRENYEFLVDWKLFVLIIWYVFVLNGFLLCGNFRIVDQYNSEIQNKSTINTQWRISKAVCVLVLLFIIAVILWKICY